MIGMRPRRGWFLPVVLAMGLCPAPGSPAELTHCGFEFGELLCDYPATGYHIQMPASPRTDDRVPVVVVLHDAGGDAGSLLEEDSLIRWFAFEGFAVVAPQALPRQNRRIEYHDDRPSPLEQSAQFHPFSFSKKEFTLKEDDGDIRDLSWGDDSGWYFYNTDIAEYSGNIIGAEHETDYIGRDEIRALRKLLSRLTKEHGTAARPSLIAGLGHGASLVWQIACYDPDFSDIYAPVGGAFWHDIPTDCKPGGRLVHTHQRDSRSWPLEGAEGSSRRFARTSIHRNMEMLLRLNGCDRRKVIEGEAERGFSYSSWGECDHGGPIELILTDQELGFPQWWVNEMLNRLDPIVSPVSLEPEEATSTGPAFKSPGARAGQSPDGTATFKRPGGGSGDRFKRPD